MSAGCLALVRAPLELACCLPPPRAGLASLWGLLGPLGRACLVYLAVTKCQACDSLARGFGHALCAGLSCKQRKTSKPIDQRLIHGQGTGKSSDHRGLMNHTFLGYSVPLPAKDIVTALAIVAGFLPAVVVLHHLVAFLLKTFRPKSKAGHRD